MHSAATHRPEGSATRGTTAPNRLRRVDEWVIATAGEEFRFADQAPLVVDLGFGASPITTIELYERLQKVRGDVEVIGLEIDPERVRRAQEFLAHRNHPQGYQGLTFARGGFELPVPRPPILVRAFNVLRQYDEAAAWRAWDRLCAGLAPTGLLIEGTCDENGRRATWVTLGRSEPNAAGGVHEPRADRPGLARPLFLTLAAHLPTLPCPSELAERLPKVLIHRNVPGEPIYRFFRDFDHAWACAAPYAVFGPRQRWVAAVEHLSRSWPLVASRPYGGRHRWRRGEVTIPWQSVAPVGVPDEVDSAGHPNSR